MYIFYNSSSFPEYNGDTDLLNVAAEAAADAATETTVVNPEKMGKYKCIIMPLSLLI
jgi:hypothetical protein